MLDDSNAAQQEALGIVGVNLIHGAYNHHNNPEELIRSLIDGLSGDRVEVDMIDFSGHAFASVDNRVQSLQLVQLGLTGAAMFAADGNVLQPSEALRKKSLLVQRGRFRPLTHVNIDMLNSARKKMTSASGRGDDEIFPLLEISMHNLREDSDMCLEDFVSRAEVAASTGCTVMISDFREYYRLAEYLARYTNETIGLAMGLENLRCVFDEGYYKDLPGGILESLGRLFSRQVRLLIYPMKNQATGTLETLDNIALDDSLQHLFGYVRERGFILPLEDVSPDVLDIHSPNVLGLIAGGDTSWKKMVPDCVASIIIERGLFGYSR